MLGVWSNKISSSDVNFIHNTYLLGKLYEVTSFKHDISREILTDNNMTAFQSFRFLKDCISILKNIGQYSCVPSTLHYREFFKRDYDWLHAFSILLRRPDHFEDWHISWYCKLGSDHLNKLHIYVLYTWNHWKPLINLLTVISPGACLTSFTANSALQQLPSSLIP